MAEGARLESVYTVTPYRGFESLPLRQMKKRALVARFLFGAGEAMMRTLRFDKFAGKQIWSPER